MCKKTIIKAKIISMFLVVLGISVMFVSAATTVNFGTTTNFAILSGSTITNNGSTIISGSGGNIGLYPGTSFVNQVGVTTSGVVHLTDTVASIAKADLVTAYNQASSASPVTRISSQLGGQTLTPGIYDSADGTFQITGTLTLDAEGDPNAVFLFKTESTLITASASGINLINDATYCNVLWSVGSSATLGTNSNFVGRIYALTSITVTTGASIQGQLLARNGAVTLDTNTIVNNICSSSLTIVGNQVPETPNGTINGGELPETASNIYQLLFVGIILLVSGFTSLVVDKLYAKKDQK